MQSTLELIRNYMNYLNSNHFQNHIHRCKCNTNFHTVSMSILIVSLFAKRIIYSELLLHTHTETEAAAAALVAVQCVHLFKN